MKEVKRHYSHFGHMCRRCGTYAVYEEGDVAGAVIDGNLLDDEVSVQLACPWCEAPFVHNLDNSSIDIEPDGNTLAALDKANEIVPLLLAPLAVGSEAYVVYDEFYAKGHKEHHWVAKTEPNIVKSVSFTDDGKDSELIYRFEDVVFEANDPRQHCYETFHSCMAFPTPEEALKYVNRRNSSKR